MKSDEMLIEKIYIFYIYNIIPTASEGLNISQVRNEREVRDEKREKYKIFLCVRFYELFSSLINQHEIDALSPELPSVENFEYIRSRLSSKSQQQQSVKC